MQPTALMPGSKIEIIINGYYISVFIGEGVQPKLGKMQKLILIYIGVKTKAIGKRYMRRSDLTNGLVDILHEEKGNNFFVAVAQSLAYLFRRRLVVKKGRAYIGLNKYGRETAREVLDIIKHDYGNVNWDSIYEYFIRKEDYDTRKK